MATRITLLLLALWVSGSAMLSGEPALRSSRNTYFEVVGYDARSVSYVNELSSFAVQIAERYLPREGLAYPTPILISLRPEKNVDFEGDYRVRLAERGSVQLDLRWEDSLTLERTCYALCDALIVQYTIFNNGIDAPQKLRAWPVTALGAEVYFALRPAEFVDLLRRARASELPSLSTVVEALQSTTGSATGSGYWLLQAMKASPMPRGVVRSLLQQAVAGIDIEEALTAAVQSPEATAEPLQAEVWWSGQFAALLYRDYDVIEPMQESRSWLAELANFKAPLTLASSEDVALSEDVEERQMDLNLRSLWTHRALPEVQALVQARYEILRLRMGRINAAYFNPARSLGVLFETILNDAPAHRNLHALTIYLSDWDDAKEMQRTIETILNDEL